MATVKILPAGWVLFVLILSRFYDVAEGQGGGIARPVPVDLSTLTPQVVKPMFDSMKRYGEMKTQSVRANQFILVLVLTENEIRNNQWSTDLVKKFDEEGDQDKRRYAFLLNSDQHGIDEYDKIRGRPCGKDENGNWKYSKHKLHGEVQFIELHMHCMLGSFDKVFEQNPEFPVFVMYSLYIPCAKVSSTPYSCSEKLAQVMRAGTRYQLLVSFTSYFEGTNAYKSLDYMKKGAIVPFQAMFDGQYATFYPQTSIDDQAVTFQGEVYQCLLGQPLSHCCTGEGQARNKMVAFFVNLLTYACTSDKTALRGQIQPVNKGPLSKCMGKTLDENFKDDCEPCSTKNKATLQAAKDAIRYCVYRSLEAVHFFGQPNPQTQVFEESWVRYEGPWNKIYNQSPSKTKDQRPQMKCGKWVNSVESMCSALDSPPSKPADKKQARTQPPLDNKAEKRQKPNANVVKKIRKIT